MEELHNTVIQGLQCEPRRLQKKKSGHSGKSRSPGFSSPEFPGFIPETLSHNTAQINHPNYEIL
jgi:hypothetical protein